MFTWTEQSRTWYVAAARHCAYHQAQAEACLAAMRRHADLLWAQPKHSLSVAEWGCGLGFLTMALAEQGLPEVTGLDVDAGCIAFAEQEKARRGLACRFETADAFHLPADRQWDVVISCYFGDIALDLEHFLAHARHMILCFVRRPNEDPFIPGCPYKKQRRTSRDMEAELTALGVAYEKTDMSLDFGQPFASLDEARAFLEHYSGGRAGAAAIGQVLDERLVRLDNGTLYLPHQRNIALFCLRTG